MGMRDHDSFVIEQFNGLWDRGDDESCPSDHFTVASNIQYFESGFETRFPLDKWQNTVGIPLTDIQRIHSYVMQDGQSLLVLVRGGKIYHCIGSTVVHGPILTIAAMEDFNMVSIAGRAYITPFHTLTDTTGQTFELGVQDEFVYVYHGDGTPARKTGGKAPTNGGLKTFIAYNSPLDGAITKGIHFLTVQFSNGQHSPANVQMVDAPGNEKIQLINIPLGPVGVTSRTIAMTHAIDPKDVGGAGGSTYYNALVIPDNVTTNAILDITDAGLVTPLTLNTPIPDTAMIVTNFGTPAGHCDIGFHLVGVVYETESGYLTAPGPEYFGGNTYVISTQLVRVMNIPGTTDPLIKKRHLISTKAIFDYNGDQKGYQYFFIPDAVINDPNTTNTKDVSYYDSDLVSDASHLLDNYESIPAGVNLNTYHGRMVIVGISTAADPEVMARERTLRSHSRLDNRSVALLSAHGEPEAVSKVDGLIIAPLDGSPLTHCQEFRDILYLFKKTRTYAYSDNFDEPATWIEQVLDQGIGSPVHGIGTVLDSGGVNTDFLLVVDWSGLMLFNGTYARPEMSWKAEDFWYALNRNGFHSMQIANDSIGKKIYITLPDPFRNFILFADYSNGLDAKNIKWAKWVFDAQISTLCLIENNKLILGATSVV